MEYNILMSLFSFLKSNNESYSLVFNIGSGSVSGGIIKFTEKTGVNIVYYAKEMIPFQQEIEITKHQDLMKSTLTILAHKIQSEGLKKVSSQTPIGKSTKKEKKINIDRIFYIFSSPWSVSQTRIIRLKEPKLFKVTEGRLNKLIDEQEKQFQTGILKSGQIIERKIVQIKTNGYVVNNIYDKLVDNLELAVFFTVVSKDVLDIVEEAVSKTFRVKNVWCHSLSLPILTIIGNLFSQKEDFIHLDISEEITDISVVKNNILTSSVSIPLGRNYFIRELSKNLAVTEEIADSMIRMHQTKSIDELASLKLSVAIDTVSQNWLTNITDILSEIKSKMYVPELIFLTAEADFGPFIKDKLHKRSFETILLDNKNIKSSLVGENLIFKLELMFLDNLYKI